MEILINSNYLIFPVSTLSIPKELNFLKENKKVYSLVIKLDNISPDFYAYVDVARFKGQTLDISVDPEMDLKFREADEIDIQNLYREPHRPQIHFTAKNGWINDPNGLIYIDGTYHMFFQYNPGDVHWRKSKHWGHATSTDLIHWKEEIALFPDERGAMFSGCAILDEKNLLKKSTGEHKTAVLFYTTTEPYAQNISYSTDHFKTVKHYEGNPIIPYIDDRNRDPKVVFCKELASYIMILYITKDIYYIFTTDDLVNWTFLQSINMVSDRECPDLFPISDSEGNRIWFIMGASDTYLAGQFKNGKFVPIQEAFPLHYGCCAYAGQTFSNLPNNRIVRMVWNRWKIKPCNFTGQMGVPMDLSVDKFNGTYYLQANPVKEIENIYKSIECYKNVGVYPNNDFRIKLEDSPYIFKIKGGLATSGGLSLSIFGRAIDLDFAKNELKLGTCVAPISITKSSLDLTIIVDRCGMELFLDNGKAYMSCLIDYAVMDRNVPYFSVKSQNEQNLTTIEIISLNSIWR